MYPDSEYKCKLYFKGKLELLLQERRSDDEIAPLSPISLQDDEVIFHSIPGIHHDIHRSYLCRFDRAMNRITEHASNGFPSGHLLYMLNTIIYRIQ